MSIGALLRVVLTRFLPVSAVMIAAPVVFAHGLGSLRTIVWWALGLQALATSVGYAAALLPLRGRLDPERLSAVRWNLAAAAVGILASGVFLLFPEEVRLDTILQVSVSGGLIAAVPMLFAAWTGSRRWGDDGE